ncbi:MAG: M3 family oligoendopeptidase [Treponema sp.]|nr:M3 family oligoendopeptidase [Treponema sp.]
MTNENIPLWNLDSIFSSLDSREYEDTVKAFTDGIRKLDSAASFLDEDFENSLRTYLEIENEVLALSRTLNAYAYIIYSVDTTNTKFLNNIARIDELTLGLKQADLKFTRLLSENASRLESFYKKFPQFEEYSYVLEERVTAAGHQMSAAEEKLAGDLQRTGGNAWESLDEQIISSLSDSESKTFNELRNDAYSPDGELRKKSWEREIHLLRQNETALAACLNNIKGETLTLNSRRNWKTALERSLFSSRLSEKTLEALITSIEENLDVFREYFCAKAEYLKKTGSTVSKSGEKGLAFYDLFAPLPSGGENSFLSKKWTFSEARDYIIARYDSFSTRAGDFARKVFDEGWIDAAVREGKTGGAYDEDFPLGHQSRIMTNFTGAFSDIITLAHEIGHAFHFSCMEGKPALFFDYPMTLAETASTFAETIVKQNMIQNSSGADRMQILEFDLQDVSQVLVDILCRFYFEKSVFEKRTESELNAEDFCALMKQAQEKSYGCGLNPDERHEYMWAVKSHYYSPDLDFYNFPYAFGQLFAAGLYMRYRKEGPAFASVYEKLLSDTGSMSCEDLCRKAGFDITTPAFWNEGIAMYRKEIEEFIQLVRS